MEKNKMKLWKKILLILLILFVIFVLLTLRKYIIVSNLINTAKDYTIKTNYIVETYSLQNNSVSMFKSYNKDGNYLSTIQTFSHDMLDQRKLTVYNKEGEMIGVITTEEAKIALVDGNILGGETRVNTIDVFDDIKFKIPLALTSKITTDKCNDKDCYLIELTKNYSIWVEKDTGIIIREINNGNIMNRNYVFDTVKDEDIIKPDISDCIIPE